MLTYTCVCGCEVVESTEDEVLTVAFKHIKDVHFVRNPVIEQSQIISKSLAKNRSQNPITTGN